MSTPNAARNIRETPWLSWWMTAVPLDRRGLDRLVAGDGTACELCPTWPRPTDVKELEGRYVAQRQAVRWMFDARRSEFELTPTRGGGTVARRRIPWPAIATCTARVMLDLGDPVGVLSCERIERAGTRAFGYLYPQSAVRAWLAGPGYPFGAQWAPPYPGDDWWQRWFWSKRASGT